MALLLTNCTCMHFSPLRFLAVSIKNINKLDGCGRGSAPDTSLSRDASRTPPPPGCSLHIMVEPQSSVHAGRAKILEPDEKIDGGEETLEDMMAKIEAIPSNQRLLKQIGVRESVKRVSSISICSTHSATLSRGTPARAHSSAATHIIPRASAPPRACSPASCVVWQCLSAKARHLAKYEMEDPRVLAIITSLMGWEMKQDFTNDVF